MKKGYFTLVLGVVIIAVLFDYAKGIKERKEKIYTETQNTYSEEGKKEKSEDKEEKRSADKQKSKEAQEAKKAKEAELNSKLGSDLFNQNVVIDGVVYTMPAKVSDFTNEGWQYKDPDKAESKVDKNVWETIVLKKGKSAIVMQVKSSNDNTVKASEGIVWQIVRTDYTSLKLPGNVGIGSTKEQVEAAYPNMQEKIKEDNDDISYCYRKGKYDVTISIDKPSNRVFCICLSVWDHAW